jgi:hypothetical protein
LDSYQQCLKARIVMISSNMPGFKFSQFESKMKFGQDGKMVLIPQHQFNYLIEHFTGEKVTLSEIPSQMMYVRLNSENRKYGDQELMQFTSELSGAVTDSTRTFIFDYHQTLNKMQDATQSIQIFMSIFTLLLFIMSIF